MNAICFCPHSGSWKQNSRFHDDTDDSENEIKKTQIKEPAGNGSHVAHPPVSLFLHDPESHVASPLHDGTAADLSQVPQNMERI